MSTITGKFTRPGSNGRIPNVGYLLATPSARRELDDETVLPDSFIVQLPADGEVSFTADDTTDDWFWIFTEEMPGGGIKNAIVTEDANYASLVEVDPHSGNIKPPLPPVWKTYIDTAIAAAQTALQALFYTKAASDGRYATTAQGGKADSAVQPADVYSKAASDGRYATTAQGGKADSAVQPAALANLDAAAAKKSANLADLDLPSAAREVLALADYTKLRPLLADLANWRNKRVNIIMIGDSGIEGYSLTSWDHTFPSALQSHLRARYGVALGASRGLIAAQNDKINQPFWPVAYTAAGISAVGFGAAGRQSVMGGTAKHVYAAPAGGLSGFTVHYAKFGASSTLGLKVDGVAQANIVIPVGTGTAVPDKQFFAIPVTASIELTVVSGAAYGVCIQEFKGDENAGIQVHNLGWSGTYAQWWNDRAAQGAWPESAAQLDPQGIIVEFGGNDGRTGGANKTAAVFKTDLLAFVALLKTRVSLTAPIILNMMWSIGDAGLREPWALYVAAAKEIAAADARVIVVDHSQRMYPSNTDPDVLALYNAASPPHAKAKGYALEASTVARALDPR